MTIKFNKIIDDENIFCMIWVNLNIMQFMIIVYIMNQMKTIVYKKTNRRKKVSKSIICDEKLSFSISIVEYNRHMSESNENVQQRAYYSSHRLNRWYWWSLFIFLLNAIVLNAFKLWDRFYSNFKLTHSKFQHQIVEALLIDEITRTHSIKMLIISFEKNDIDESSSCEWEHADKKSYCRFWKKKKIKLWKRSILEEISENLIKKNVHHKLAENVKTVIFVVKKIIADVFYIVARMHSMMTFQCSRCMCENYEKGEISEVWLIELRFIVSTRTTMW